MKSALVIILTAAYTLIGAAVFDTLSKRICKDTWRTSGAKLYGAVLWPLSVAGVGVGVLVFDAGGSMNDCKEDGT